MFCLHCFLFLLRMDEGSRWKDANRRRAHAGTDANPKMEQDWEANAVVGWCTLLPISCCRMTIECGLCRIYTQNETRIINVAAFANEKLSIHTQDSSNYNEKFCHCKAMFCVSQPSLDSHYP
jgi:hypothetical protein